MRSVLVPLALTAVLAGCASPPTYRWTRPAADQPTTSRDLFECHQAVAVMFRDEEVIGPLWWVTMEKGKIDRRKAEALKLCMEGRGYTRGESVD